MSVSLHFPMACRHGRRGFGCSTVMKPQRPSGVDVRVVSVRRAVAVLAVLGVACLDGGALASSDERLQLDERPPPATGQRGRSSRAEHLEFGG